MYKLLLMKIPPLFSGYKEYLIQLNFVCMKGDQILNYDFSFNNFHFIAFSNNDHKKVFCYTLRPVFTD